MNIFRLLFGARAQFLQLSGRPEEEKSKNVRLGVQGLILTIVGFIVMMVFVVVGTLCAQQVMAASAENYTFPILSFIGAIVFYAFALAGFFMILNGNRFALLQKQLNKMVIGKVGVILSFVLIALSIIGTILILVLML